MVDKINEAVCRFGMGEIFEGAVIGFSGGADSGALLHFLKDRCKNLLAVHINHMIRGEEADRDEEACRQACLAYGVELLVFRIDIPALSRERKKGLEETAREERYRVFHHVLEQRQELKCIVTAHNANDNAETVLFNLARGSGSNGLSGIKPVFGKVYRPLIYSSRDEIIKYCTDNNIKYVTDSTNSDTDYTRNRIRHNIIPELMKINPGLLDSCVRLGDILRRDEEFIQSEAGVAMASVENGRIPRELACSLDAAVLVRVLKIASGENLDYKSVEACIQIIKRWETGKMVNLEKGLTFKLEHSYCSFIKTCETAAGEFYSFLGEGINYIDGTSMVITLGCDFDGEGYEECGRVRLCTSGISGALYVRSKQDGDCVKSCGMTKKLKRVFADLHIPSHKRTSLPVICDGLGVVAVPGIIARDGAFDKKGDLTIKVYIKNGGVNEKEK